MPRVMIINYAFPPLGGAASRRTAKLVKYLDRLGWSSVVITAPRVVNPLVDPEGLRDLPPGAVVVRTASLEPVAPAGRKIPGLDRLHRVVNVPLIPNVSVLWALCALGPAGDAVRKYRPRAVLCSAPEFPAFLIGAAVKARAGLPLILDYRDEWSWRPEKEASVKGSPARRLKQSLEFRLERRLARYADALIANTESFRSEFIRRFELSAPKVRVITNGYDPEEWSNLSAPKEPDGELVMTHVGSVDHPSIISIDLMESLLETAAAEDRRVRVVLVGKVRDEHRRRLAGMESAHVKIEFTGFVPAREALTYMVRSDLNLLVNELIPGKERYHNLKLFDYLRAGRPILHLGPAGGEIARVVRESGLGAVVEPDDPASLKTFLRAWLRREIRFTADEDYVAGFDFRRLAGQVAELLEEVAGN